MSNDGNDSADETTLEDSSTSNNAPPRKKQKKNEKKNGGKNGGDEELKIDYTNPMYLGNILRQNKQEMQGNKGEKKNGITVAIIGGSGCGKSTLIRKVFLEDLYADNVFLTQVFTNSAKSDAFKDVNSKKVVVCKRGYDPDFISWCFNTNLFYDKKYNFVNIMDDCLEIRHDKQVRAMFCTMRNMNISSICSLQYSKLIPPAIRTSVYFTFIFKPNNEEGYESAVKSYLLGYLPGKSIREKSMSFRQWIFGGEGKAKGHRFFLLDNLSNMGYRVDENYICYEIHIGTGEEGTETEMEMGGEGGGGCKRKREDEEEDDSNYEFA
jgi:hypothetical protein